METAETSSSFDETAKVGNYRRAISAAIEDPTDEVFPALYRRVECLYVRFSLSGPSEDERRAILEIGHQVSAVDT